MVDAQIKQKCGKIIEEWFGFTRHIAMRMFFQFAREKNLSFTQLATLFHLYKKGPCTVSEFSHFLTITHAASSQMLDRLVQLGFVRRWEDKLDRRVKFHELAKKGRRIVQESIQEREFKQQKLLMQLDEHECRTISNALILLMEKIKTAETVAKQDVELECVDMEVERQEGRKEKSCE